MPDIAQRLFLILPPDPEILRGTEALLASPAVACALIRGPYSADTRILRSMVKNLQQADVAVLVEDIEVLKWSGADGIQVMLASDDETSALHAAIRAVKPNGIVGVAGLRSRHAAMAAGELDADYVMFGEPDSRGEIPPLEAVLDRGAWWSEIFTIPCVVFARNAADIEALMQTGCNFIAIGMGPGETAQDLQTMLVKALRTLQVAA